jgi:2,3-bisphosphoglycerate-independent phosphoglycerate mutase
MTRYESSYSFPIAFTKDAAGKTLGQVVSDAGIEQLRCAETEKYPHVTFFFNGGRDDPLPGESRLMAASPKVATYDLQPEMSADEVAQGIESALAENRYGLIVVNFANADMVGHTGVPEAVIKSVEVVDEMVGRLWKTAVANDYSIVLTADHGNADMLQDPVTGDPHTQHTTFPVPCVVHDKSDWHLRCGHGLPALAPTVLALMGLSQPDDMKGQSLLLAEY